MDLLHLTNRKNHFFSIYTLNLISFLTFFMFSIFLYNFDKKASYFMFVLIILAYSFLNFIIGYLSLDKGDIYILPFLGIIFGFSNIIHCVYWLVGSLIGGIPLTSRTSIPLIVYLRPYLTAIAILFACKFLDTKPPLWKSLRLSMVILIPFLTIALILNPNNFIFQSSPEIIYSLNYIKVSIITLFYLISIFYLWEKKNLIKQPIFIFVHILFVLIATNEVLVILIDYFDLHIIYTIIVIFTVYFLFIVQLQYSIIFTNPHIPTRQHLYMLNSDLMNRFFTFKDLEVQNLQTEISTKDKLYKQLFDFAPDAFLICIDDAIVYINQATLKLLNAPNDKYILSTQIWDFIHPNSVSLVKSHLQAILTTNQDAIIDEIQILSLDKQTKDVRISSRNVCFDDSYYIISCLHDLSNHKEQERIQLKLEKDIAHEKFKVEFFANISHDLKTPINVIYSAIQLQDMCALSNEYDKVRMYNNIIKQNCLRLQKLLNDLLDITKIDANHFKPHPELCNIIYTIEYITQSITSYVEHKNISITFDTNVEEKFAMTDPDLIERVVLNLISNAIKYGKQDGHIWVTLYDEGEHLIMSIKDDGIGIPECQAGKIFKRFHKAQNNTNSPATGNGIGLSLVKSIVEVLGGTIFCISKEGDGSEFIVILPMPSYDGEYRYPDSEYATSFDIDNKLNIELSDI